MTERIKFSTAKLPDDNMLSFSSLILLSKSFVFMLVGDARMPTFFSFSLLTSLAVVSINERGAVPKVAVMASISRWAVLQAITTWSKAVSPKIIKTPPN